MEWPVTTIKNYIVQGTGADLVMIARISLFNRMKAAKMRSKLIMTVHDSIVGDCPEDEWEQFSRLALEAINDVPKNFERLYKVPFNLELNAEVLYGANLGDMKEWKP
jgi:DNA polymerase-1